MEDITIQTTIPVGTFDELLDSMERDHDNEKTRKLMEFETVFNKPFCLD